MSHRTFGNVIYNIVQKYSELSTSKLRKLEKLSKNWQKLISISLFHQTVKFLMLYQNFWRLIYQIQMIVTQDLSGNDHYEVF